MAIDAAAGVLHLPRDMVIGLSSRILFPHLFALHPGTVANPLTNALFLHIKRSPRLSLPDLLLDNLRFL